MRREEPGAQQEEFTRHLVTESRSEGVEARVLGEMLYDELRAMARRRLQLERGDHTLQPTALVHEAWMRLVDQTRVDWRGRAHFLALAAQSMRRILVDHARKKGSAKRGGQWQRVVLEPDISPAPGTDPLDLVALDAALTTLRELSERQARVVELRFFGGLELKEVADVLEVSLSTVERDWRFASAWLTEELREAR